MLNSRLNSNSTAQPAPAGPREICVLTLDAVTQRIWYAEVGVVLEHIILKRDEELQGSTTEAAEMSASDEKENKQKESRKEVLPPTKAELQELDQEFVVQCKDLSRVSPIC